ncbi:MAG: dTMP kinase [Mariprofundus sp.]|nr:dTMP kinase [Mariprofundus sp.]
MGKLITFEGGDGCGKSTQLRLTAAWLRSIGKEVVETFEPGDSALGSQIRKLLLAGEHAPVPECELLLFLADRAQHVREKILPALKRGSWILCDRFSDSTMAYQLAARHLDCKSNDLAPMLKFAECGVSPDMTLWFDLPVEIAAQRMLLRQQAGEKSNRLDDEAISFHQRVAAAFAHQAESDKQRVVRIDAAVAIESVQQQLMAVIKERFAL